MNYQEIENKLVEFAHKKEGKEYPIHDVNIGTAVDFAMELVKNCSIPDVVWRSEQLVLFADWLQYNGKWDLPEEQVKNFLSEQKQN